jgi:hypothetical protein
VGGEKRRKGEEQEDRREMDEGKGRKEPKKEMNTETN